jgi:hypothetical protein
MRESRTYGSVRGALSNERPYRDRRGACHRAALRADPLAPRNDDAVAVRPYFTPNRFLKLSTLTSPRA